MQCPKCQFENPEDSNFCLECGQKLEQKCPQCEKVLPVGAKFCNGCGHKLTAAPVPPPKELSFDEKLDKIQRYLPKGLTEKILAQRDRIEGERKQVTVMFCDLEGFTQLSEKLGPEDAYSIMDHVYEILIHKVHDYEGTVNEMTGDGIMALFGAPIALEDAPQRAIRSAYAIHREMTKFSDKIKQEKENIPPLKMRIGIHTGPVVVGTLGNDLRVEFKAVGDTVNLASRIEGLSEPGSTYVSKDTYKLTEGLFRFEALGELIIKGKAEKVKAYRVIASSTRRTRFDVSAERGLTPFIGRERELELLLDGFERAKAGRGQAFSIMAEAGVGKSRLLYEFRKAVTNEDVTFLEGKCLSYSRGVSYHPVIDILKSNFDIREDDGDLGIREKVSKGLRILGTDEASTFPYFLELLSVKDSGIDEIPLSPEAKKDRIFEALKRIVLIGSEIRPLIMVFEDLHWIDKSSEEYLKDLLDTISGARVFLIFTYRPEFVHTWGGKSYHSQVNLTRLSNRESLTMVSHLLGAWELDKDLEQLILEKTEGVPFFIEELIGSLIDQRIIEKKEDKYHVSKDIQEVIIPSTIQDVIMARVDSLPEAAKGLLQIGSVAGREFSHDLIKGIAGLSEEALLSHLSVLKDSELLYERGIYPQSTYIFKHALTHEVAYDSMLHKRRREIHQKIGKALEQIYADRLEELCEMLAYHYLRGEDWQRAYSYNLKAGLKALSLSAYEEAQRYFETGLGALKKLPHTRARIEQEIDIRFNMRAALFPLGRHDDWPDHVRTAQVMAKEIGDKTRLANAYNYLSTHLWINGRHRKAIELCEEGLKLAEEAGDFSVRISTMFHLGVPLLLVGEYGRQVELHREIAQALSGAAAFDRHGMAGVPSVLARGGLAWALAELGEFEEAEDWGHEGIEIAEQVKNAFSSTWIYACLALAYLRIGRLDQAMELLQKAFALIRDAKVKTWFSFIAGSLGYAHLLIGRPDLALPILEEAVRPENLNVLAISLVYPVATLADAYRAVGKVQLATETVSGALKLADEREERGFEAWAMLVMAGIKNAAEQLEEAQRWYRHALQQASDLSMRPLVAHCHKGLANSYLRIGDEKKAQLENEAARKIYRSLGMTYWLQS